MAQKVHLPMFSIPFHFSPRPPRHVSIHHAHSRCPPVRILFSYPAISSLLTHAFHIRFSCHPDSAFCMPESFIHRYRNAARPLPRSRRFMLSLLPDPSFRISFSSIYTDSRMICVTQIHVTPHCWRWFTVSSFSVSIFPNKLFLATLHCMT